MKRYGSTREVLDALRNGPADERERLLELLEDEELSEGITALDALMYDWSAWGREEQQPPPDDVSWRFLFLRAGRGGGKTRAGAEMTIAAACEPAKCGGRLALIAPTHGDIRITMVEGTSGILACSAPWMMPEWQPGYGHGGRLLWPGVEPAAGQGTAAGDIVQALCFSAEKPDRIRGPETGWVWGDEIAAWGTNGMVVHDIMSPGLRFGTHPRAVYTSTPKPTAFVEYLDAQARKEEVEIASGALDPRQRRFIQRVWSTFNNAANLPKSTVDDLLERYAGTTQGRQELDAELMTGDPDALWSQAMIDEHKVTPDEVPELLRIVVAVDNATTVSKPGIVDASTIEGRNRDVGSNDTGIGAVGEGADGDLYVLGDATCNASPEVWGTRALELFADAWQGQRATYIVIERNMGGDLINRNLQVIMRDRGIPEELVPLYHVDAADGKEARAEPVVTLYERGRVHHVHRPMTAPGAVAPLADLEYQMTRFKRGKTGYKKDRVDWLVWACTALLEMRGSNSTSDKYRRRARAYVR